MGLEAVSCHGNVMTGSMCSLGGYAVLGSKPGIKSNHLRIIGIFLNCLLYYIIICFEEQQRIFDGSIFA